MFIIAGENWNSWDGEYKITQCNRVAPTISRTLLLFKAYEDESRKPCVGCGYHGRRVDIYEPALPRVVWLCASCHAMATKEGL